jgi:integrase/recombinase XerD
MITLTYEYYFSYNINYQNVYYHFQGSKMFPVKYQAIRHIDSEHELFLENYLLNLKQLNKSEHTIRNYRADLMKFILWIEQEKGMALKRVNGEMISEYKEFLQSGGQIYDARKTISRYALAFWFKQIFTKVILKKRNNHSVLFFQNPMSVGSRRRHLSSIKNFFEFLKETHEDKSDLFLKNPVKSKIHAIKLKDVDVDSTKMIKKEDFDRAFEKSYRTRDRLMLYLLYYGGLRLSELCFLKKTDFDFENKSLTFHRKGGSIHTLYIQKSDVIFSHVSFYINQQKTESLYLFSNKNGKPFTSKTIYNQIIKILKRVDVKGDITPHSFRKACATNLYRKHKDLLLVRDYLNHSDAKVTQTYIDTSYFRDRH